MEMALMRGWFVVAVVVLGCAGGAFAQAQTSGKTWEMRVPPKSTPAPLTLEPAVIELGDVRPGSKHPVRVVVRNAGDETIDIVETRSTCWCAVTELSDKKVGVGESVVMSGEIEVPDALGELERQVYVFVKGYSQPITVQIRGEVSRGIRVRTEADSGQSGTTVAKLESIDGEAFTILGVGYSHALGERDGAVRYADGFDPETDAARSTYSVRVDSPGTSGGYLNTWVGIATDREGASVVDVNLLNRGGSSGQRPPTSFKNERVYLGAVRSGEINRVSNIALLPGGDGLFAAESVEGLGGIEVRVMGGGEAKEGPEIGFGITVTDSTPGVLMGEVRVVFAGGARGSFYVIGYVTD
jgi:hypothetical protein